MEQKQNKRYITLYIDEQIKERIEKMSKGLHIPQSSLINFMLRTYIKNVDAQKKDIEQEIFAND